MYRIKYLYVIIILLLAVSCENQVNDIHKDNLQREIKQNIEINKDLNTINKESDLFYIIEEEIYVKSGSEFNIEFKSDYLKKEDLIFTVGSPDMIKQREYNSFIALDSAGMVEIYVTGYYSAENQYITKVVHVIIEL